MMLHRELLVTNNIKKKKVTERSIFQYPYERVAALNLDPDFELELERVTAILGPTTGDAAFFKIASYPSSRNLGTSRNCHRICFPVEIVRLSGSVR